MSNIGFIGLGIMGKPMALNLIKGGHTLHLYSRGGVPQELTAAGGKTCANSKEVAQKAEIVIIMVPDTPDVEKVLFGEYGVASGLGTGKTVVGLHRAVYLAQRAQAPVLFVTFVRPLPIARTTAGDARVAVFRRISRRAGPHACAATRARDSNAPPDNRVVSRSRARTPAISPGCNCPPACCDGTCGWTRR